MSKINRREAVVATHIVLFQSDQILLQRRFNTGFADGQFSLPAGHVEAAETVSTATAREALEELGVHCAIGSMRLVHVMHRNGVSNDAPPRIDFFMAYDSWEGKPAIMEPDKADDLRWFSVNRLPPNTVPYIRDALEAIASDVQYSEHGWTDALAS